MLDLFDLLAEPQNVPITLLGVTVDLDKKLNTELTDSILTSSFDSSSVESNKMTGLANF